MWSFEYTATSSVMTHPQRIMVLHSTDDELNSRKKINQGIKTFEIPDLDDKEALVAVDEAMIANITEGTFKRDMFCLVAKCAETWTPTTIYEECKAQLQKIKAVPLDILILPASIVMENNNLHVSSERCLVAWEQLCQLQDEGFTKHLGVADFDIPALEILLNRHTEKLPTVNEVNLSNSGQPPEIVRFCHSHQINVSVRLNLRSKHQWIFQNSTLMEMAKTHSMLKYEVYPASEQPSVSQKLVTRSQPSTYEKTSVQVFVKSLLQQGILVSVELPTDEAEAGEVCEQLVHVLHPFIDLNPSASPSRPYTLQLSDQELTRIATISS